MNLLNEISRGIWMIQPEASKTYFPMVHNLLNNSFVKDVQGDLIPQIKNEVSQCRLVTLDKQTNLSQTEQLLDFPESIQEDSIFVLDLIGPITKYDQFCGPAGTKQKASWLHQADSNPNIVAHIIYIDSPGGEGYAARSMAEQIKSLQKPVVAFVDCMAASAAYLIASACSLIVVSHDMDRVGSIGTYITVADYSAYFSSQGIRIFDVYAQASSDKNKDYLEAIEGNTQRIQKLVDTFNDYFLSAISENRADSLKSDDWKTGDMFFGKQALEIGLIDHIASFDQLTSNILKLTTKPKS